MNWKPYITAIISTCTAFAPVSRRERNSRSRSSGSAARAWRSVNPAKRTSASPARTPVVAAPRPSAPMIAYTVSISAPVTSAAPG